VITGLGALSLLAVLLAAIRRGERAALATAFLSVLALNFFFIEPRYHLAIAHFDNVVALAVLLVAAVVVGRLASQAQRDSERAEARAREAELIAAASSGLLEGAALSAQLSAIETSVSSATGGRLRLGFSAAPQPQDGETTRRLATAVGPAWLYGSTSWRGEPLERISAPLTRLIDVAREGDRVRARSAEAEAAQRADIAKTALLHTISHDLRSPLTAIVTAISALQIGGLAEGDRRSLESAIDEEAKRLARMVDDLLDLSKIEAGAVNPRPDWCDLRDVALSAAAQVRTRNPQSTIEAEVPSLPLVRADAAQLERVLSNLIENAVKFSPPSTRVRLNGGSGGGRVIVRVTDEGPGIPPAERNDVFLPFFRGRRAAGGSGLGLAICRGLVEANGGRINLQDDAEGGTSFAVSFELVAQPVQR
jgi:two-component system sensor histidine kinase KdpD